MRLIRANIKSLSDEELMVLFQRKDHQKAITEIYSRYADRILRYFIKMFNGDEQRAQDFLQDLFIKVIEKKHQFNTERKFYTWIFTIASNMCKTSFRKSGFQEVGNSEEALLKLSTSDFSAVDRKAFRKVLRREVHQLEHHHKVVFILRHLENFSIQEIAEITETSEGTVKSRLFYGTKKLSQALQKYAPDQWDGANKIS